MLSSSVGRCVRSSSSMARANHRAYSCSSNTRRSHQSSAFIIPPSFLPFTSPSFLRSHSLHSASPFSFHSFTFLARSFSTKPPSRRRPTNKNEDKKNEDKKKKQEEDEDEDEEEDDDDEPPKKKTPKDKEKALNSRIRATTMMVAAVSLAAIYGIWSLSSRGKEITWQEFRTKFLEAGRVHHLKVDQVSKRVTVYLNPDKSQSDSDIVHYFYVGSIDQFERQMIEAQKELEIDAHDYVPVKYMGENQGSAAETISSLFSIAVSAGLLYFAYRAFSSFSGGMGSMGGGGKGGRNIFSIGKSPAQVFKPGEYTKVTFKDVAGLDEAKVEVMEFVQFLKAPEKFTKLGAKVPKGALLCGPPGTGKTLLAKAMAGEASVPFFSISGSDFIEMFVGVGPSRVRDLFAEARKSAPCIIFIDEIDAVGRERGKGKFGGNDERENTLNQMLVEMDGFQPNEGVVVLAGTNRKDILDPALLRPGRFDRQIQIDKPDLHGRTQIFEVHLKKIKTNVSKAELAPRLAALTPGFAGADIANLCNEAALIAARSDKEHVELVDFEAAADRVIGGLEKKHSVMSIRERTLVAYHEAGHAVVGWFLEHTDPVLKVTIVPRGNGALGFAQYLPNELSLYQKDQLLDMMCMALGGRASENHFFGKISTGASDDLKRVTRIAQAQITHYGMNAKLGNVSYAGDGEEGGFTKPFSESTGQMIDEEVRSLIAESYRRTEELVDTYKDKIKALALTLLEKETVNHDVLVEVLGPRPHVNDSYKRYLDSLKQKLSPAGKDDMTDEEKKTAPGSEEDKTEHVDSDPKPTVKPGADAV